MLDEALANPGLLELAAAVTRQVGDPAFVARGSREQAALRRFVAGGASYFHELWSASTREERLQLYALAKGGYVNPSEVARQDVRSVAWAVEPHWSSWPSTTSSSTTRDSTGISP